VIKDSLCTNVALRRHVRWAQDGSVVNQTSTSLLDRLRHAPADAADWQRLHGIYQPVIRSWLRHVPGLGNEVDDLAQEVLVIIFRELPSFKRRRDGSFRSWLRQITLNRIRNFQKAQRKRPLAGGGDDIAQALAQLADPASELVKRWDQDHDRHVFEKLLALVKPDFAASTWEAFMRYALENQPAAEVAAAMKTSLRVVVKAKYRVLKRLREEAGDLLDA
jgi:RNA polymerase sigma-70 factor (ECF subfamily)